MTASTDGPVRRAPFERLVAYFVELRSGELVALLVSFGFFFSVLTAYLIIRPVRDEMGMMLTQQFGQDMLQTLFVYVLLTMLAALPLFGAVVTHTPRRWLVPAVYGFFIFNLAGFWVVLASGGQTRVVAQAFFIWVSVFNLFIVSLFWSVMSETWTSGQAKRLYGFIAAGGSVGAMTGPLLAQSLVMRIGADMLLAVSAAFLLMALLLSMLLRVMTGAERPEAPEVRPEDQGILAGASMVLRSRYLMSIALWVFLANLIVTYFYLEQARIIGAAIADRGARVQLLARVDLAVSVSTIVLQVLATGRIISRLGIGIAMASVPTVAIAGFIGLAMAPVVSVIVCVMIAERVIGFAFANPAARVLWTSVPPEAKYKAQNFVDTVIFRSGDAASGWVFGLLSKTLGLGGAAIAFLTVPFAIAWLLLSLALARMHGRLPSHREEEPGAVRAT